MRPYQERPFTRSISDDIPRSIGYLAPMRGERGEAPGTQANRPPPEKPYDPNLVCPMCGNKHCIGEIQKFRIHVNQCNGPV